MIKPVRIQLTFVIDNSSFLFRTVLITKGMRNNVAKALWHDNPHGRKICQERDQGCFICYHCAVAQESVMGYGSHKSRK